MVVVGVENTVVNVVYWLTTVVETLVVGTVTVVGSEFKMSATVVGFALD